MTIKFEGISHFIESIIEGNSSMNINTISDPKINKLIINNPRYDESYLDKYLADHTIISRFPLHNLDDNHYSLEPYDLSSLANMTILPYSQLVSPTNINIHNVDTEFDFLLDNGILYLTKYASYYNTLYNNNLTIVGLLDLLSSGTDSVLNKYQDSFDAEILKNFKDNQLKNIIKCHE